MQLLYSMSRMVPSLCKLFVSLSPKKLSRFILVKKKKKRSCKEGGGSFADTWKIMRSPESVYADAVSSPQVCMQMPHQMEARRHSSYQGSPPRSSISYIMGRKSDVLPGLPRLSTSSASCYERLSGERGLDLPPLLKLGAYSGESGFLSRQDSAVSLAQHRRSSCSSATSFVSCTSSRLKHAYARQKDALANDLASKQPHIGELFAGNQFLTHLTAVPAASSSVCENALLQPSSGLLDASLPCREAELKDRIILFL
ncbi:hypothetical protein GOP47_0004615 [Adiantum capillus-veneris]|uniref:Uncharacterized protein n=1 Tax=Adiantum capillus-veneris TaxID=13818 RepID=A0A9D4V9L1_ADICA|nr:hypothetical protein GOP47_0004615 [Adiantum capillus-veneris]